MNELFKTQSRLSQQRVKLMTAGWGFVWQTTSLTRHRLAPNRTRATDLNVGRSPHFVTWQSGKAALSAATPASLTAVPPRLSVLGRTSPCRCPP